MFGTNTVARTLSFGKVLSGISKGLTIANQAIPIYEQVKPMIGNAKKLFSIVKEFKNTPVSNPVKEKVIKEETKKEVIPKTLTSTSNPQFFL